MTELGLLAVFLGGTVSFLSPCVLPLVPGYLAYISGCSMDELQHSAGARERMAIVGMSLAFVLGFSTVFVLLGASTTYVGQWLLAYRQTTNLVGGALVIVFGLFMTGLLNLRWLHLDLRWVHRVESGGPWSAYVLGVAFAFGWTPCIGPILGAILTISTSGQSGGVLLLSMYSLGLGLPFLLTALFTNSALAHLRRLRRWSKALHVGAGVVMVLMGIAMITGRLTWFSYKLLEWFPVLGTIG